MEIREYGGLDTAKKCLHGEELGAGFLALYGVNRLDLSLEALRHDNPIGMRFFLKKSWRFALHASAVWLSQDRGRRAGAGVVLFFVLGVPLKILRLARQPFGRTQLKRLTE